MTIPERISALRKLMEERGYDVYMIPTDDFHQSEYVGDHFKVREYMTGFCRNCHFHKRPGWSVD